MPQAAGNDNVAALPVTIYSDVICPWCYIGKRRFETALDAPGMPAPIAVSWRPFELNPDMPEAGMPRADYRARKFGPDKARELDQRMIEIGREEGIVFAFDRMRMTPSTRLAHRLIWQAGREGETAQGAIVERLFRAYFEEARDIGSQDVLLELAAEAGLDGAAARRALTEDAILEAVLDLEDAGIRMGIRGVPFFLLIDKYAISGAQPPELWRDALPKIAAEAAAADAK
jgi:predicted DsbA family dithiol-disulfide isomerase